MLVDRVRARFGVRPGLREPISAAAGRLGTTPRMLRYREALGLVSPPRGGGGRRSYGERELLAAGAAVTLEEAYGVPPGALAFALRALSDPQVAADVRTLGALARGGLATPIEALDFDARKARELLRLRH
ncbi:MAG TPA: MerR family DNA-binding transcriptional regulator [Mycobacteriales bacterium]|jgi:DNA-binding transcriptional MerR regulator|nr:MerR family DNA-binding transcriptional regulator [Mycobacteriales bacterium]